MCSSTILKRFMIVTQEFPPLPYLQASNWPPWLCRRVRHRLIPNYTWNLNLVNRILKILTLSSKANTIELPSGFTLPANNDCLVGSTGSWNWLPKTISPFSILHRMTDLGSVSKAYFLLEDNEILPFIYLPQEESTLLKTRSLWLISIPMLSHLQT